MDMGSLPVSPHDPVTFATEYEIKIRYCAISQTDI
jgi:hypothetical protein